MSNIIARLDYARRVEERYAHHIEELLTPIVGVNRVRAKVTANIDFTQTEETKERYIPGEQVVRSEKLHEERILNEVEGGVPGAVSNQPPAAQAADGSAIALAGDGAFPDARKKLLKRTRNFEVGKVVSRTQKVPGRLERLSVAVVIDNGLRPVEQQPTDAGQSDTQADAAKDPANAGRGEIDAARLAELTELVKEAIGFDEARGDRVKIMTSQFPGELAEVVPSWWENSQLQSMAKLGIAVIAGLLILLVVVRPLVKSAVRVPDVPRLGGPANQVQAIQNSNGQVEDERIHEGEVMHVNYQPDATSDTSFEGLLLAAQKVTDNDPQRRRPGHSTLAGQGMSNYGVPAMHEGERNSAILLMMLSESSTTEVLKLLEPAAVERLAHAMGLLENVKRPEIAAVLREFFKTMRDESPIGESNIGGSRIRNLLVGVLGKRQSERGHLSDQSPRPPRRRTGVAQPKGAKRDCVVGKTTAPAGRGNPHRALGQQAVDRGDQSAAGGIPARSPVARRWLGDRERSGGRRTQAAC